MHIHCTAPLLPMGGHQLLASCLYSPCEPVAAMWLLLVVHYAANDYPPRIQQQRHQHG
jgi:hypothetical protein